MENNKPRKISFTILAFFYIFLPIFESLLKKKKGKELIEPGRIQPIGPVPEKKASARARPGSFAERTTRFYLSADRSDHYTTVSLTTCR